jgi:hypothetical protein
MRINRINRAGSVVSYSDLVLMSGRVLTMGAVYLREKSYLAHKFILFEFSP